MRIQHNIMVMSAYRNYTNNVSAMKKNLERLSSGYKINRAGDDAAGLAISEKMRAQITGLETAQKNAKDGISLVQTAEGALTEVHDMLNRMVELATQSANGTYDNDTDRYQLQKEMDQLRDEINRIADSSNFNGIQLLDGSMDAGGDTTYVSGSFKVGGGANAVTLPAKGSVLGTNTVVHEDGVKGGKTNAFSIDLHNLSIEDGTTIDITFGDAKITVENNSGEALDAKGIVDAIINGKTGVTVTDADGNTIDLDDFKVGGGSFKVEGSGTRLTFTQDEDDDTDVEIPAEVTIEDPNAAGGTGGTGSGYTQVGLTVTPATTATITWQNGDGSGQKASLTFDLAGMDVDQAGTITIKIGNNSYDIEITEDEITNKGTTSIDAVIAGKLRTALAGGIDAGENVTLTLQAGAGTSFTLEAADDTQLTDDSAWTSLSISAAEKDGDTTGGATGGVSGDYNKSTTVIETRQDDTQDRLASTKFTLDKSFTEDGCEITIGNSTYTFTTDKTKQGSDGYVYINESDTLEQRLEKLTKAAENNGTYTVGFDGTSITITENPGQTNFDLTTVEGIEKSLGYKKAVTSQVDSSKGLTLQIGDTADSYNQLKVNIKDCHTLALGIADISIARQDDAQAAVDAIRSAINYVSDVRGTLGATQNRLDHTINNLSVMTENIQDAESTIRDTDIAEEMMAYTKNNILIQSAQAMLAQANQVPQGVLQLLQ